MCAQPGPSFHLPIERRRRHAEPPRAPPRPARMRSGFGSSSLRRERCAHLALPGEQRLTRLASMACGARRGSDRAEGERVGSGRPASGDGEQSARPGQASAAARRRRIYRFLSQRRRRGTARGRCGGSPSGPPRREAGPALRCPDSPETAACSAGDVGRRGGGGLVRSSVVGASVWHWSDARSRNRRAGADPLGAGNMSRGREKVAPEVVLGQVWRAPDGLHCEVAHLFNGRASLLRAKADGRVLNRNYRQSESSDQMRAAWTLILASP